MCCAVIGLTVVVLILWGVWGRSVNTALPPWEH